MESLRLDKVALNPTTDIDEDGFLRAKAIVTRTGIFQYRNADGSLRNELRHPVDVLSPESLATMKMLPVTNEHPIDRLVTPENAKYLSIGFTGENIENDGDNILSNFVITDRAAIEQITGGLKNQLSLGYVTDVVEERGVWQGVEYTSRQKNIRYNHLALVNKARAGDIAKIKLDSQDAIEYDSDVIEEVKPMAKRKIKIDAQDFELEETVADSYEKLKDDLKNLEDEKRRVEEEIGMIRKKLEEAEGERDSYKEEVDSMKKNDSSQSIQEAVKERLSLFRKAERILGAKSVEKMDSASDVEIMKSVIMHRQKSAKLDGKADTYIKARFDSLMDMESEQVNVSNVTESKTEAKGDSKEPLSEADARKAMIERQRMAYKQASK